MATIKDIAQEVGVSCTTVSNVINGKSGRVSADTISRINEAIDKLGYVPNMSARSLVSNSSKVIGIINHLVPRKNGSFVEDPFHSAFIGAIEETLRENGYYIMLRTVEDTSDLTKFLRNWNVDGMFFTGLFEDEFFETLCKVNIPIVLIDSYIKHSHMCNVGLEDKKGGYLATKYLIDHGHTEIAFASPHIKEGGVLQNRLDGYKEALAEAHIPFNPKYVFQQEIDVSTSIKLGRTLANHPSLTAIFATADILAAGIMAGIHQEGKSIPDDMSILGFDDINLSRMTYPPLTTIHQDAFKKGSIAVEYMIEQLEGKPISKREVILPVHLVERDSVKQLVRRP